MIALAEMTRGRVTLKIFTPDAYDPPGSHPVVMSLDMLDRGPARPYGFRRFAPVYELPAPLPADLDASTYAASSAAAAAWLAEHGPAVVAAIVAAWEETR